MKHLVKIFLVDDDPIFLGMLRETLRNEPGLSIQTFRTGEECLKVLNQNPDVIVLDYYLNSRNPKAKNGMQILKQIVGQRPQTKVIILSGQEDGKLVYKLTEQKAADYVIKDERAFENIRHSIHEIIKEIG